MENPEDLTFSRLELCTYRYLQQLAKSLALPSNVKKVYLIEMIYAKKYRSAEDLDAIVVRIREERKLNAQTRKPSKKKKKQLQENQHQHPENRSYFQGTEVSSTSNQSPPINLTPRRPSGGIITYPAQVRQTMLKYQQRSNILHSSISKRAIESDRVLRSFHNRMRPNYSLMSFNDSFLEVIEAQNARLEQDAEERQYRLSVGSQSQIDVDDCVMHRRMPTGYRECTDANPRQIGYEDLTGEENNQLVPVSRKLNYSPPTPANRQRRLSGIYPLKPPETAFYMRSFGVRGEDGRISKINAVVQKPLIGTLKPIERNKLKTVPRSVLNPIVRNHSFNERNKSLTPIIVRRNAITRPMASIHDLIPRPPDIATVQEIVDYTNDRSSFSNSSTETATETSVERDNIENVNRKTVNKNYGLTNLDRFSANNYGTQITKRYTDKACNTPENMNRFAENSNYTTENRVRYKGINYNTENPNFRYADKSNRAVEYANTGKVHSTENINKYAKKCKHTENVSRFVENNTYAIENPTTHADSANYATENMNAYIANSNYVDNSNMYLENGSYAIENGYAKDVNRNTTAVVHNTESRNTEEYPNMSALTDIDLDTQSTELISKQNSNCSVYYHKKIRAEQVRSHRPLLTKESEATEERLPSISEVFGQFHDAESHRSHLLSLQTRDEPENATVNNAHTLLESLYNFRPQFLTNQPLDKIKTTSNTRCVYSVPTITTAVAHRSPAIRNDAYPHSIVQRDNQQHRIETETVPRLYDYFKMSEQDRVGIVSEDVISPSSSSFGTTSNHELEADATIPEMVEDALELISQDGDYMERIEMDIRMQCILCDWAGPKIILEYHIRKEHSSQLVEQLETEWRFAVPHGVTGGDRGDGGGEGGGFSFHPVLYKQNIYVLATSCTELHFTAMLMVLPTVSDEVSKYARITVYNKVTGEPHTWQGEIADLPETVPFGTDCNGLKLDITELNLLPNSANLKLARDELIVSSTAKVVVGHTEMNNIEIVVHVKVFD